jgi:hypothetical protein
MPELTLFAQYRLVPVPSPVPHHPLNSLSAKNPNAPIEPPLRHTQEILAEMKILDTESAEIIKVIKELI